ncbi:MAG: ShlB/FhaC/HecB family hemolysin secretion/activation protein [Methylacidiphilales bacterium]|nr:ShlB/FhaC/HecB family hemolysin secretion/activation protein [Candidatus Methylacidiphilales bacterium]
MKYKNIIFITVLLQLLNLEFVIAEPVDKPVPVPEAVESLGRTQGDIKDIQNNIFNKQIPTITDKLKIFDIPPVYDRPLGIDEGEKIPVNKITITGVIDRPENSLFIAELQRFIEEQRFIALGLDKIVDAGLTNDEWNLLRDFVEKGTTLTEELDNITDEFKDLIKYLRYNKSFRTGLSVGQLQLLANKITEYYRDRGFLLSEARLPEQSVIDGVVTFKVLEGTLGQIKVFGGISYSSQQITNQFEDLLNQPITKSGLESRMMFLQDLPGLTLSASLARGVSAGESDLVINVEKEKANQFELYIDNQGVLQTGSTRLRFSYTANNPTSSSDSLTLLFQTSQIAQSAKRGTFYGSISYSVPISNPGTFFDLNYGKNTFKYNGQPLDIEGDTSYLYLSFRQYWVKTRELQMYSNFTIRNDSSTYQREGSPITNSQKPNLDSASLSYVFSHLSRSTSALNSGSIEYTFGTPGIGFGGTTKKFHDSDRTISKDGTNQSGQELPTDFSKLSISLSRLQSIDDEFSMLFKYSAQFTNDPLFSLFQSTLGGPGDVRSVTNSYYIRDNTESGTIEFIMNSPGISDLPYDEGYTWGQVMQFSLFYDYSSGYDNFAFHSKTTPNKVHISGYGFGFQFNHPDYIFARLTIGFNDISKKELNAQVSLDRPMIFAEIRYSF